MTRDIHRTPPHSMDAEQGLLGSMILDRATIVEMRPLIQAHYLYIPAHQIIFRELCRCESEGKPTDLILFTQHLRTLGLLDSVGGASFVTSLYTFVPTAANVTYYAAIVIERHQQRVVIESCTKAVAQAYEPEADINRIKLRLWDELKATEARRNESQTVEVVREIQDMVSVRQIGGEIALKTGIPAWDKGLHGVFPKRFYVLGSRPKVGKSASIEISAANLIESGHPVLIFQRDMSLTDMLGRMACRKAGVIFEDFATGTAKDYELERVGRAAESFNPDLLRIYSPASLTADELSSIVQREAEQFGIVVFYLDLFQRLVTKKDRVEGLTEAANTIRALIQTTGIPGIIAAELRQDEDRKKKRPHSGQFKYCDGLFSNCDTSILLWSDQDPKELHVDQKTGEMDRQRIYFTIDANRGGGVGEEIMWFDRPRMTFHEEEEAEEI